jgi:hypothetical protein
MTAIREFATVKDHQLHIELPEDFDYEEVEVIVMPRGEDLSFLQNGIEDGIASGISPKTHTQIVDELKKKYV